MELTEEELHLFELAFLLRMPVHVLVSTMPYDEYLGWANYFERRPNEWRSDARTALLANVFGAKTRPEEMFDSLRKMSRKSNTGIENSVAFQLMCSAVGGDKLDFLNV